MDTIEKVDKINSKYILKVTHIPFYGFYMDIEETEEQKPKVSVIEIIPQLKKDLDLDGIKINVLEVNDEYIKFIFSYNQDVYINYPKVITNEKENDEIVTLKVNETKRFYTPIKDIMEYWKISFVNKDMPPKKLEKCPICGEKLLEYAYVLTMPNLTDELTIKTYEETRYEPKYKCINCNINLFEEDITSDISKIEKLEINQQDTEIAETYTDEKGENKEMEKNTKDDIILFKIKSETDECMLTFSMKNKVAWLDFCKNNNPDSLCISILNKNTFDDFKQKITQLTKEWSNEYKGKNELKIKWHLKEIDNGKIVKNYIGFDEYPVNWNEFIEYIKSFEIICKQNALCL